MPLVPVAAPPQPGSRGVASNLVSPIWGFLSNQGFVQNPPIWGFAQNTATGVRAPPSNLGGAQNPRIWGSQSGGNFWGAPLIHRRASLQEPGVLGFPLQGFPSLPEKKKSVRAPVYVYVCVSVYIYIYIYIFFFSIYIYIYIYIYITHTCTQNWVGLVLRATGLWALALASGLLGA